MMMLSEGYELRESQSPYKHAFTPENCSLRLKTTIFGRFFIKPSYIAWSDKRGHTSAALWQQLSNRQIQEYLKSLSDPSRVSITAVGKLQLSAFFQRRRLSLFGVSPFVTLGCDFSATGWSDGVME